MYQFAAAMLYVLLLFLLAAVIYLLKNIPAVLTWRDVDKTCTISQGDSGGSNGAGSDEDRPGSMIGARTNIPAQPVRWPTAEAVVGPRSPASAGWRDSTCATRASGGPAADQATAAGPVADVSSCPIARAHTTIPRGISGDLSAY